jgi:hypothetical protein
VKRLAPILTAALLLLGGCDEDDREGAGGPRLVSGSVDLDSPRAGAPDAGTARGHGADVAIGSTTRAAFAFEGRVDPPDSMVTITDERTGRRGPAHVSPSGEFTAGVTGLRLGQNTFLLRAAKRDHEAWRLEVRIVRRPAPRAGAPREVERRRGRVEVPAANRSVPEAGLRVERPRAGEPAATTSSGGSPARVTARLGEELRVTATTRDPEDGAARARVSIRERSTCLDPRTGEGATRLRLRYFPPAQTARARVPPGVTLPRERSRTVRLRFDGDRCPGDSIPVRLDVLLWSDATNAHETESSSAPVRLTVTG